MNQTVLLTGINAKYIHSNPAVYSLKAYADKYYASRPHGCRIEIAEYTVNQPLSVLLADLYRIRPRVAAFSCYIWNWSMVQDLLLELPKILPDTALWLGGPEVSFHAEELLLAYPQLAGIMVGEGEETFLELLKYYWEKAMALRDIRGIVCKEGFTGERGLVDINRIPFIYGGKNDIDITFKNRLIYYESQRGCPFRCAYCLSSIDKKVRLRDIGIVKNELQYFLDHRAPQVKFIDRTFNCSSEHALSVWEYLKENDNGITNFHFEIAADLLDDRQLEVIKDMRPGLIQLEVGIQSTNGATLEAVNRRMDITALRRTVAAIHSFQNVHQHLDLIAGLPYEDYDTFAASFNDVHAMEPDQLQLGFLKVLKGSPMEQRAREYGIVHSSKPPYEVLYTEWMEFGEMLRLKGIEEMVEMYYNSGQFSHTLPVLLREFDSPFHLYETLAGYYRTNGYLTTTPSRGYRYQILFDFACSIAPDKHGLFAELLTFDLYLRDHLKSRPIFSPENRIDREKLRSFFEREAQLPRYLEGYTGYTSAQLVRMTHVEGFTYPVWEKDPAQRACRLDAPGYILFDYKRRNALTHDAAFYEVEMPSHSSASPCICPYPF